MVTNNIFHSDLFNLYDIVSANMALYPKELIIATLRDFFSKDSYYHYVHDQFGYPETPDLTDTPRDAGFHDTTTTRIMIGESSRFDVIYYPALIVRNAGFASVPISINRESQNIQWDFLTFEDGYGNIKTFRTPKYFIFADAWEGNITIDIYAKDLRTRDDLIDLTSLLFWQIAHEDLKKSGLFVKSVASSSASENDLDRNDRLFRQTITLTVRTEWRRKVPVGTLVEIVNTSIEFGQLDPIPGPIAPNLTINNQQTLEEILEEL
jgi:hypothetical protein